MKKNVRKTIVFSSYDDIRNPYYAGGGARAIHEVAKELAMDYQVIVFTGNYPGAKDQVIDSIQYKRIGLSNGGPKIGQLVFQFLLPFILKKQTFDVWIESFTPPFSTIGLQRYTDKPVIGLAHMLSSEDMRRKYKLPFHLIEQRGLLAYKHFITITEKTKRVIRQSNKRARYYVIPNGVAIKHQISVKTRGKHILFLGRIEMDQKGLDLLLDAYAMLVEKTPLNLIIAGSGTEKEEAMLRQYISSHNLQNRVFIAGRVEGKRKERLLREAAIVAVPSRYETFGNVVLEAMAYNKPIIGFAIDGLAWVPTSCMIKIKPFDTQLFAQKLLMALSNKKQLQKMQKAAGNTVREYSWENTARAYKQTIEAII